MLQHRFFRCSANSLQASNEIYWMQDVLKELGFTVMQQAQQQVDGCTFHHHCTGVHVFGNVKDFFPKIILFFPNDV